MSFSNISNSNAYDLLYVEDLESDTNTLNLGTDTQIINIGGSNSTVNITGGTIPITGVISLPAGSVSAPSMNFQNDPSTGIYEGSVSELSFAASGQAIFKIAPDGLHMAVGKTLFATVSEATHSGTSDLATNFSGSLSGDVTGTQSATLITALPDSKLATISSAGKVSNSATTATSSNTTSAIVTRDSSGNFSANQITSNLIGNVDSVPSGTLNLGVTNCNVVNLGTTSTTQICNIGIGSGQTMINLGGPGDSVNVNGTLTYVNTTNLQVTDKTIT